jgi:hypothetical protein
MNKKIAIFILTLIFVVSQSPIVKAEEVTMSSQKIKIGDYISYGQYDNKSITWQLIGYDAYGNSIFWSQNILAYMAFDAAESGMIGSGSSMSDAYGSNIFENSTLKDWLNSSSQVVDYTTTAPSNDSVYVAETFDGTMLMEEYDYTSGFLKDFSEAELEHMLNYTYLVDEVSTDLTKNYSYEIGYIADAVSELGSGKTKTDVSKVFLLSLEELNRLVVRQKLSWIKTIKNQSDANYYWLRTLDGSTLHQVMTIDTSGNVFKTAAVYSHTGVVPGILLNTHLMPIESGKGTSTNPYTLDLNYQAEILSQLSQADKENYQSMVTKYLEALMKDGSLSHYEEVAREIEDIIYASDDSIKEENLISYYLADGGVKLHRALFDSKHLLNDTNNSVNIVLSDLSTLNTTQKEAVNTLVNQGIINGYQDGTFKPEQYISRSEIAKVVTLILKSELGKETSFKDIKNNDWFMGYVEGIKDEGLVTGYTDGTYKPLASITYDEVSAIVARILKEKDYFYPVSMTEIKGELPTGSYVSSWAEDYVALLYSYDMVDTSKAYKGTTAISRIDLVVIMNKVMELLYE